MTTETKTPAEMLLESGLLEQKCDGFMCREGTVWVERDRTPTATKCLACTGTGLRYWRLIRKCKHDHICTECVHDPDLRAAHCRTCQGRGYMVAPDAEIVGALMEELKPYLTVHLSATLSLWIEGKTTLLAALVAAFLEVAGNV